MDIKKSNPGLCPLSISALVAALLGFAFYWWVPGGDPWHWNNTPKHLKPKMIAH